MILKGSQRGGEMKLARHLMNMHDNDHVELHELRGFVADDLIGAFKETHAISLGTKCSQFLFSLSLSPPELENVPVSEFEKAIDAIEKKIGLVGQPRAIIFHEKAGRRHAHCVWSRIDPERMRAINLPHFKMKLQDISRQLYIEHQWQMPLGLQNKADTDPLNFTLVEAGQAKRVKVDPQVLKAMFQKYWAASDSKVAFSNALKEQSFMLAKGDRRGFVAVDQQGEVYSISRWVGVKAKEVRARLGKPDDLPSVEEAQALIQANICDEVLISAEKITKNHESQLQELEQRRDMLVSKQRQARDDLKQNQQACFIEETKTRAEKLPTGLKAAWSKLSGKYQKISDENETEIRLTKQRNRAEHQQLVQYQLKERQALQQEIRQIHFEHEIAIKTVWQEMGRSFRHLNIDPAQPLIIPVDEEALTIAAKVRRNPRTILDVISDKKEVFTRNDILRGLAKYIDEPTRLALVIDKVFQSKELVELETAPSPRYTTRDMQSVKVTLAEQVQTMAKNNKHTVRSNHISAAIAIQNNALQRTIGATLSEEQENAINHVLGSEQIANVVGFAGAGKSTMLSAARSAWEQQGYRVIGAALSGKAADGLESSSGIESRTLASLEHSWKNGYSELQANDVLVIDEAGMIGTRQLARFVEKAQKTGAKLVLVGDPEQLQPIQAGTPFKDICDQIDTAQLTEIRRQKENWQRQASIGFAEQRTGLGLQAYEENGFVKIKDDNASAITALVEDYMSDVELYGLDALRLALAHRRKDVHKINQTIRAARQSAGELSDETLFQTIHGPRAFAKDDRILLTRNDRELGLRNGMLGTVESVDDNL